MLEILIILLLSVTPAIENRGAMLLGFSLGITNPLVYVIGTVLNIMVTSFYFTISKNFKRFIPEKVISTLGASLKKNGPISFILLIPSPMNGINAFTASIISNIFSFDLKKSFLFISVGVILRGITTYAVLIGAFSLAEYANLTGMFYLIVVLLFLPLLFQFVKPAYDSWKQKNKTDIIIAIIFLLALITIMAIPEVGLFFKFFIDPISVGISTGKVASFFAFGFLFFLASILKPRTNFPKIFLAIVITMQIITVLTYFLSFSQADIGIENHLFKPSFFVSDPHISYNNFFHIHSSKPTLVYPLAIIGYPITEEVYDYGLVFLKYVPNIIYLVQFILLILAIAFAVGSSSQFKPYSKKLSFLLASFILIKLAVDGGPFNIEFLIGISLLYFSMKKSEEIAKDIIDCCSKTIILLVPLSALIYVLERNSETDLLTSVSKIFFLDMFRVFYSFTLIFLCYTLENKLFRDIKEKIKTILLVVAIILFGLVINKELGFNDSLLSIPLSNGDVIRIMSPYQYTDSQITQINYFYLSTFVFHSNSSVSRVGNLFSDETSLEFLKFGLSVENKTCLMNVSFNDTYLVYGKLIDKTYEVPFANISTDRVGDHYETLVVSNACIPSKSYWIADYLLGQSKNNQLILIKK